MREFAEPGEVEPDLTCGGCGALLDEDELKEESCAECGQVWPTPPDEDK